MESLVYGLRHGMPQLMKNEVYLYFFEIFTLLSYIFIL
jgi:hypothetical protein